MLGGASAGTLMAGRVAWIGVVRRGESSGIVLPLAALAGTAAVVGEVDITTSSFAGLLAGSGVGAVSVGAVTCMMESDGCFVSRLSGGPPTCGCKGGAANDMSTAMQTTECVFGIDDLRFDAKTFYVEASIGYTPP